MKNSMCFGESKRKNKVLRTLKNPLINYFCNKKLKTLGELLYVTFT